MPKAIYKKRFHNPGNPERYVDIPIVGWAALNHAQGVIFKKLITKYNNDDGPTTERKVHLKTLTHKALGINGGAPDAGDDTDTPTQRIIYEVIDEYSIKTGSGVNYNKLIISLKNKDTDTNIRKTHEVRIRNPDHDDWWADIKRTDEDVTTTGQGVNFKKTITKYLWDDDEFNASDVPVIDGNFFGERLDPLQNIVNVRWGDSDVSPGDVFAVYFRFQNRGPEPPSGVYQGWGPPIDYPGVGFADNVTVTNAYALAGYNREELIAFAAANDYASDPVANDIHQSTHSFPYIFGQFGLNPGGFPGAAAAYDYVLAHYQPEGS